MLFLNCCYVWRLVWSVFLSLIHHVSFKTKYLLILSIYTHYGIYIKELILEKEIPEVKTIPVEMPISIARTYDLYSRFKIHI